MNASQTLRLLTCTLFAAGLALLSVPSGAQAEASCKRREAPALFVTTTLTPGTVRRHTSPLRFSSFVEYL